MRISDCSISVYRFYTTRLIKKWGKGKEAWLPTPLPSQAPPPNTCQERIMMIPFFIVFLKKQNYSTSVRKNKFTGSIFFKKYGNKGWLPTPAYTLVDI